MAENNNPPNNQVNIEIPDDIASGVYSNFVIIGHTQSEFVLDYVQVLPGIGRPKVKSRIIMSPLHAKRLLMALNDNVQKFEAANGSIPVDDKGGSPPFPPGFTGPAGYA